MLICGWRRLEALRRLGRRTLSVWVRSGISDQLSHLLAQQDENEQRKPLSPVETARLYAEIKMLEKEEGTASHGRHAVRRAQGAMAKPPAPGESPDHAVTPELAQRRSSTGKDGWQRLEQINWIESIAEDESLERVRARVRRQHARARSSTVRPCPRRTSG